MGTAPNKKPEEFRDHGAEARASVKEFYRLNHTYQTREFVLAKQREFANRGKSANGDLGGHGIPQHPHR